MNNNKSEKRIRRHKKIRAKIVGDSICPRLSVYKSNKTLHVQLINDEEGQTIATVIPSFKKGQTKVDQAREMGKDIAQKATGIKVNSVVFDRGGFRYAGRIKAFADGAREGGLKF